VGLRRSLDPRRADVDYVCFCFDQAGWFLINLVEGQLDAVPLGKGKNAEKRRKQQQERLLKRILGMEKGEKAPSFRDPAAMLKS
jgi:hypothetical protein